MRRSVRRQWVVTLGWFLPRSLQRWKGLRCHWGFHTLLYLPCSFIERSNQSITKETSGIPTPEALQGIVKGLNSVLCCCFLYLRRNVIFPDEFVCKMAFLISAVEGSKLISNCTDSCGIWLIAVGSTVCWAGCWSISSSVLSVPLRIVPFEDSLLELCGSA